MSRNMIEANRTLFERLSSYCASHGDPVIEPNKARWVHSNSVADDFLKDLKIRGSMSFGRYRHIAWLQREDSDYLGLTGFEHDPDVVNYPLRDDVQGFDVCLIAELPVQPNASPAAVRNVVEAGGQGDPEYGGHDNLAVMALFPRIVILETTEPIDESLIWATFLRLCVDESSLGGSWIEDPLAPSLSTLAELAVPSLPYRDLCRAVFDLDPRSLYMSLYRCIEATYAYEHAARLASALSVTLPWHEVAASLETEMGWRPPEAQSLNVALTHAHVGDLEEICDCLNVQVGLDLRASAGKAIYKLRNQIVHYRPASASFDLESIDWIRLCNLLVTIALDVFSSAYS